MKNTEEKKIGDISPFPAPKLVTSTGIDVNTPLSYVTEHVVTVNDLCRVLLKIVGEFEEKANRKLSLITFGPKVSNFNNKSGWKNERSIKFRWAETEIVERLVE